MVPSILKPETRHFDFRPAGSSKKECQTAFYGPSSHINDSSQLSLSSADRSRTVGEFEAFTARMQRETNRDVD
jgi:hypothetical protein